MRNFYLARIEDVSGSSGTGLVAQGVQLDNGICIMSWLTEITSFKVFMSIEDLDLVHSHEGRTRIVWQDEIYKLQEELDEGDPLLELIRGVEDRRTAKSLEARIPPSTLREAVESRLKAGDIDWKIHVTNDIRHDPEQVGRWQYYEELLRRSLEDLRELHAQAREVRGQSDPYAQLLMDLGTHIHEVDIALENTGDPTPIVNRADLARLRELASELYVDWNLNEMASVEYGERVCALYELTTRLADANEIPTDEGCGGT